MKVFVTNHAIERFKERYDVPFFDESTCIRMLQAMVYNGVDYGGNVGKDIYKLNSFNLSGRVPEEIVLVVTKAFYHGKPELLVKTVLTKQQAIANMQCFTKSLDS